jgi:hypothetical protein
LIDIFEHGHVNVCEYVEYNCEYWVIVGPLTLTVWVTLINEVYKRRMANDDINKKMNNLVDILSLWSWCSSIEGGIDGNRFRFWRTSFVFFHSVELSVWMFVTEIRYRNLVFMSLIKTIEFLQSFEIKFFWILFIKQFENIILMLMVSVNIIDWFKNTVFKWYLLTLLKEKDSLEQYNSIFFEWP